VLGGNNEQQPPAQPLQRREVRRVRQVAAVAHEGAAWARVNVCTCVYNNDSQREREDVQLQLVEPKKRRDPNVACHILRRYQPNHHYLV
jgi:hypothetical protein